MKLYSSRNYAKYWKHCSNYEWTLIIISFTEKVDFCSKVNNKFSILKLHRLLDFVSYSSLIPTSLRSALSLLGSRNFQLEQDAAVVPVRDQYSLSTTVPVEVLKIRMEGEHCGFLVLGNTQKIIREIWQQFWHKNGDENRCHWNYFQIPWALSELPESGLNFLAELAGPVSW